MVLSFLIAAYLHFGHVRLGFAPLHPTLALVVGVIVTTLGWLAVTLLTPPTDRAVLQSFYDKIRPAPAGWRRAVDMTGGEDSGNIAASFLACVLGCLFVYATLFAAGWSTCGSRSALSALRSSSLRTLASGELYPRWGSGRLEPAL